MIDWKYADLMTHTSVKKTYVIEYPGGRLTNDDLILEAVEVTEAISNDKTLTFGRCVASSMKFKTKALEVNLIGQPIIVKMVVNDDYSAPLPMGTYVGRTEVIDTNGLAKTISCYDILYDVLNTDYTEWYHELFATKSEMSIQEFRNEFFDHVGIYQYGDALIMDYEMIHEQNVIEEITGSVILNSLCELNGCFGRIGRIGAFEYVTLQKNQSGLFPSYTLYPASTLFPGASANSNLNTGNYISCKAENFEVRKINCVEIVGSDGSKLDEYALITDKENKYRIMNNLFVFSTEQTLGMAQKLYEQIRDISYQPFSSNAIGNPCMEPGDSVRIQLADGRIIDSYIFKRSIKGIHALYDNIGSSGTEFVEQQNTGAKSEIQNLRDDTKKKIDEIKKRELGVVWVKDESEVKKDKFNFYCIEK